MRPRRLLVIQTSVSLGNGVVLRSHIEKRAFSRASKITTWVITRRRAGLFSCVTALGSLRVLDGPSEALSGLDLEHDPADRQTVDCYRKFKIGRDNTQA